MLAQRRGMSLPSLHYTATSERNIFVLKSGAGFQTVFMENNQLFVNRTVA